MERLKSSGNVPHKIGAENVAKLLELLGKYGKRWIMCMYFLIGVYASLPSSWHMFSTVFLAGVPHDYHCRVPTNTTLPQIFKNDVWRTDQCRMYKNLSLNNDTVACNDGWVYYTDYDNTIVTEWNLVCEDDYLTQLSQTILYVGILVGAMLLSPLADMVGRKTVHVGCQISLAVVGVLNIFTTSYISFAIMRFLVGILQQGVALSSYIQTCELFPSKNRTSWVLCMGLFWSCGIISLSAFAYVFRDWRHLQLLISLPSLLILVSFWWMPESVPWLLANGEIEMATKIIRKATRNNENIPQDLLMPSEIIPLNDRKGHCDSTEPTKTNKKEPRSLQRIRNWYVIRVYRNQRQKSLQLKDKESESFLTLIRHPKLRRYMFAMSTMWFGTAVGYYGISLGATTMVGNRYLNFGLIGIVDIPAVALTILLANKLGRRLSSCFLLVFGGAFLIVVAFIPVKLDNGTSLIPLIISVNMLAMFCMGGAFRMSFIYVQEIYPTNFRNTGIGISSVCARIGGMLAPFVSYSKAKHPWLSGTIVGIIVISVGLIALLLPETVGKPLPQAIDDIENLSRVKTESTEKERCANIAEGNEDLIETSEMLMVGS